MLPAPDLSSLRPRDPETGLVNVVIETTKGSRNKFAFDPELGLFRLKKVLPKGAVFPFDFGFIPSTRGEDGDPLDVLVLMDEPTFPGCVVPVRLLGVVKAEQSGRKKDKTVRNDRLVAAVELSHREPYLKSLKEVDPRVVEEIEHFFVSYNELASKVFIPTGRGGPNAAKTLLDDGLRWFLKAHGISAA